MHEAWFLRSVTLSVLVESGIGAGFIHFFGPYRESASRITLAFLASACISLPLTLWLFPSIIPSHNSLLSQLLAVLIEVAIYWFMLATRMPSALMLSLVADCLALFLFLSV
jgi:hypothetical protein